MTDTQRNRILILTEDVQKAAVEHDRAETKLKKVVAELNDYVREVQKGEAK